MKVEIGSAVRVQLLTMGKRDREIVDRAISLLQDQFPNVSGLQSVGPKTWLFRAGERYRLSVVQADGVLRVVALARAEEIQRYSVRRVG